VTLGPDPGQRSRPATGPGWFSAVARWAASGVGLATLAGAILRLAFLARQPIGYDEDFTAVTVHQTPARMFEIVSRDSAPPLFYALERTIIAAFDGLGLAGLGGPGGPVSLRLLPALAGVALIPLVAEIGRRVAGDRAAFWTALFVAFCPATVWLSGFARMYGLAAVLVVASTLLLWRAVDGPAVQPSGDRPLRRPKAAWIAYVVCAAAAVWTDYFSIVALAGIALAALWLRPGIRNAAAIAIASGVAVASLLPWFLVAGAQLQHSSQGFWVGPLSLGVVQGTLGQLLAGPRVAGDVPFSALLDVLQGAVIVVWLVSLLRLAVSWRGMRPETRRAATFALLACGGVLGLVVVSFWRPILDARYAGLMWMPMFAFAGAGLAMLPRSAAALGVALALASSLSLSIPITHTQARDLIPEIEAQAGPHDLVATTTDQYLILLDEANADVRAKLHLLRPDDPPWFSGTAAYPAGAVLHAVPADVVANRGRVFWVAAPGRQPAGLPAGYQVIQSRCVFQACLTVYGPAD
jgi:4-amino-4-deoxy-L-arabinose transferase-like glycosyltransferase